MKPIEAQAMMNNMVEAVKNGQAKPDDLIKACNSVARASIDWAINAQRRDTTLLKGLNEVRVAAGLPPIGGAEQSRNGAAPAAHAPAQVPGVPRGPNGLRLNADGTEMDAQQSALEDQMDGAVGAAVAAGEIQGGAPGHTPFVPPQAETVPEVVASAPPPEVPVTVPVAPPSPARAAAMDAAVRAQTK